MKLFSVCFGLTLSFLIIIAVFSLHIAYFPAPEGPERPKYPETPNTYPYSMPVEDTSASSFLNRATEPMVVPPVAPQSAPAQTFPIAGSASGAIVPSQTGTTIQQMYPDSSYDQYQKDLKQYEKDSKEFMKDEMIPYIKDMIIRHIAVLVVLEIVAIFFVRFVSVIIGTAYAVGGLLGIVLGGLSSIFVIPYTIITSFASSISSDNPTDLFDPTSFFAGIGWTAAIGVVILSVLTILLVDGMLKFNLRSSSPLPPEER